MHEASGRGTPAMNNRQRLFTLLVLYRWASLVPPLIFFIISVAQRESVEHVLSALGTAVFLNISISLFSRPLNRILRNRPWLLGLDLVFMAGIMALSDGWRSPYYLYALNPLLAAAFFFDWRGAILATTAFLPFYGMAVSAGVSLGGPPPYGLVVLTAVIGFYLISGTFGYAITLLSQLRAAREVTEKAQRDVSVIHNLAVSLHNAADVEEVQQRVLEAITNQLRFERAVIGLVSEDGVLTGWLGKVRENGNAIKELSHPARVPLSQDGGGWWPRRCWSSESAGRRTRTVRPIPS